VKPVNLLPSSSPVVAVAATGAKPNLGMIGGAALGVICVLGVAGYFAMARVDSVKSETTKLQNDASTATTETGTVSAQIASLGQPVTDSDKELAAGREKVLLTAYSERQDFVLLARELRGIMPNADGWYTSVKAGGGGVGSTDASGANSVTIEGYMVSEELLAGFDERAEATKSLKNADTVTIGSERLRGIGNKKLGRYFKFTLTAELVDLVAPESGSTTGSVATDGTTVGSGGSHEITLSLDSNPPTKKATKPKVTKAATPAVPAKVAAPANPFGIAAAAAGGSK